MKITWTSLILDIVGPRSISQHNFEMFLHLPQYKLSGRITQRWYKFHENINVDGLFLTLTLGPM